MFIIRGKNGEQIAATKKDGTSGKEVMFKTEKEAETYLLNLKNTVPFVEWTIVEKQRKK